MNYREFPLSEQTAAAAAFFSRNFVEAEKLYRGLSAKDPNGGGGSFGGVTYQSALGWLRFAAGDKTGGTRFLNAALAKELDALRTAPHHPEVLYRASAIEASLGKTEAALQHLAAATDAGWIDYRLMQLDPPVRLSSQHPIFQRHSHSPS